MRRSLVVLVVALAFIAAGCGGSDPEPSNTASVNQVQNFADQQLESRLDADQTADPFTCEEDRDAQHWKCTTEIRADTEDVVPLTVNVSCDDAGSCVYKPET